MKIELMAFRAGNVKLSVLLAVFVSQITLGSGLVVAGTKGAVTIAEAERAAGSPVSRVVALLQSLSSELDTEMKQEDKAYDAFKCWFKKAREDKTASNEVSTSRIDALNSYVSSLQSGKVTLTNEEETLTEQIADLNKGLEATKVRRADQAADYQAAQEEMKSAIAVMDSTIAKLAQAQSSVEAADGKSMAQTGVLVVHHSLKDNLQKVMHLGRDMLDASQMEYLNDFLENSKGNHKEKAEPAEVASSSPASKTKSKGGAGGVLNTLLAMKKVFESSLQEAKDKEKKNVEDYERLNGGQFKMLASAQKALSSMNVENGARGVAQNEAESEAEGLVNQVKADKEFLADSENNLQEKEEEFNVRRELQLEEKKAISEAIAILNSDDMRDVFRATVKRTKKTIAPASKFKAFADKLVQPEYKAFGSGLLLLQTKQRHSAKDTCKSRLLASLAAGSMLPRKHPQLELVAQRAGNALDKVIESIEETVFQLKGEDKEDLAKKNQCNIDLSNTADEARASSVAIDTLSDSITQAKSKSVEIESQIKEFLEKKKATENQITSLTRQHEDEKVASAHDQKNDRQAVVAIQRAKEVLDKEEESSDEMDMFDPDLFGLAQVKAKVHSKRPTPKVSLARLSVGGKAKQEPPKLEIETEYEGKKKAKSRIIEMLDEVEHNMENDISASIKQGEEAEKEYAKMKGTLEQEIAAIDGSVDAYTTDLATQKKTVAEFLRSRGTDVQTLDSHMNLYTGLKPGCDYILVNFDLRKKLRAQEVKSLKTIKMILENKVDPDLLPEDLEADYEDPFAILISQRVKMKTHKKTMKPSFFQKALKSAGC